MQISSFRIDRFGAWSDLQLNAFSPGLNVIYGPNGSGKTTLVQFIRAMLYGFDDDVRRRYLTAEAHKAGGALTIQGPFGTQTLQRHDVGDRPGQLTCERSDGALLGPTRLQELTGDVPLAMFEQVFLAGYLGSTGIEQLIDEALAQGFDLLGSPMDLQRLRELQDKVQADRQRLAGLPATEAKLAELLDRRNRLQAELETLRRTLQEHRESGVSRLQALAEELTDLDEELDSRQQDLQSLDADIAARKADQCRYEELVRDRKSRQAELADTRREQLRELDAQLERWQLVLQDLEARQRQLQAEPGLGEPLPAAPEGDPRQFLRRLETRLEALQQSVLETTRTHSVAACHCQPLQESLQPALQAMREDVYRLCNELGQRELNAQHLLCSSELTQLRRCETELRQAAAILARRRANLLAGLSDQPLVAAVPVSAAHGPYCQCLAHPLSGGESPAEALPDVAEQVLAELSRDLLQLQNRRQELVAELERLQLELETLQARREQLREDASGDLEQTHLASCQADLERLLGQIQVAEQRAQLTAALAAGETELRLTEAAVRESVVLREASELTRRLTNGDWQRITLTRDRTLLVHNRHGERLAFPQLNSGAREQVHLSLCLAMVAEYARREIRLPLILNDAFLNIDAQGTQTAASLLRDFAQQGHQVLLLTRHLHLAELFRSLNVAVRDLPPLARRDAESRPSEASTSAGLDEQATLDINRELDAIAAETVTPSEPLLDYHPWNSEEFPGELTDRVRPAKVAEAVAPAPSPDDELASEYFLLESSAIQDAPSIDSATADRLRKIGVLQVRDLLRLKADEAAGRLRYAGITATMIRRWQAEAHLACRVARLRPYDARILVACGITDPNQLAGLEAEELLRRVDEFSATSLGQVLLRSGNRYELSRLTDWIGAARRLYPGRTAPRETAAARRAGREAEPQPGARPEREAAKQPLRTPAEESPRVLKMEPATANWRFHLEPSDDVEAAPSIGPRMAERFYEIDIRTIADFLRAEPAAVCQRLQHRRVTAETIVQWQQQALLVCRVPELRGHDAQLLVACGVTEAEQLAKQSVADLLQQLGPVAESAEGKRILRNSKAPDAEEIGNWIRWAAHARKLRAA